MVLDDKESGPEMDECYTWEFTRDGKRIAAAALLKRHWSWIVDGVPGPAFDVIGSIEFSPDGLHFAYGGGHRENGFGKPPPHRAHRGRRQSTRIQPRQCFRRRAG